ncbi:MAG: chromate efflux transporter [Alphaproteobacteria bacterium]|jgi:chromate transporter|nr:chromate efflux transporter [Alphaproteobacteria bacterium]
MSAESGPSHGISLGDAFRVWVRISLLSFGGPAGQIAVMHRILVDETRWISESRFLHALNYCMLLPGPEAQQLATYIGWLLHRTLGGLIAGILFVLPGAVVILGLSILYAGFQELSFVEALFFGIKAAVLAVVIEAVLRIGRRALKNAAMYTIAAAAFIGIFFLAIPFPIIVAAAAAVGVIGNRLSPAYFAVGSGHEADSGAEDGSPAVDAALEDDVSDHTRPSAGRSVRVLAICLTLWLGPLIALFAVLGPTHVYLQEGLFFSKMAVVTFGGAYAVLAYVAQQAVDNYGWLAPGEMLDGLGMAETTPGPLIMVVQFVGFMGAYRNPGMLDPMTAGILGAMLTTWVTFVPCFLWIFLGAPYIEALRGNRALAAALSAITAAVVGVVLNLAVWFALHVVFGEVEEDAAGAVRLFIPVWSTIDWAALAIAAGALVAMLRFKVGMIATLFVSAALGMVYFYTVA